MRQICAKRPGPPALDGFQLGVRVSEFPREMSCVRARASPPPQNVGISQAENASKAERTVVKHLLYIPVNRI